MPPSSLKGAEFLRRGRHGFLLRLFHPVAENGWMHGFKRLCEITVFLPLDFGLRLQLMPVMRPFFLLVWFIILLAI